MMACRASLIWQALSVAADGRGFNSHRPPSFAPGLVNLKASTARVGLKNDGIPSTRRIRPPATTSETDAVTSGEDEGSKPAETIAADAPAEYEEYEVELEKPIGLKFYKGADGGIYIDAIAPGGNADKTKMFTVGDKVLATSAVFGTDIWPAAEYGRTMYTIRQRVGTLLMRMQKRYGKIEDAAAANEKDIIAAERNAGFISDKVREIQMQNYLRKMELKSQRETEINEGDDSAVASPRLWRPGSSACAPISSYPMSGRAQEIAKGRQELMNMYAGMPESTYELSLKDLVEQKEAMEKRHHRTNIDEPHTKRGPEKGCTKRTVQRLTNKKRNGPKGFLLNIFLPGNLTIGPATGLRPYSPNSPRISRQNSDQSSKISSQESGKHEHHTHSVPSFSKMKTSQSSAVSASNSNSKISPKPCSPMPDSGKFGQRDQPSNCDSSEPKPKSSKRCSMCSEHIIFFKTNCQACGKVFCSSCAKVAIESTPEGRKCQDTCDDQSYGDRDLAPQVNSCWYFPWSHKVKSKRKARNPSSEKVK